MDPVNCEKFKTQELVNTVWAFATLQHLNLTVLEVVKDEVISRCKAGSAQRKQMVPQDVSNLVWDHGTLRERPIALLTELADLSLHLVSEFHPQHLSNIAWTFATLRVETHDALMKAISSEAKGKLGDFRADALATLAWSMGRSTIRDGVLLDAIATRSIEILDTKEFNMRAENIGMLLEAFACSSHLSSCWHLLDSTSSWRPWRDRLDGASFGAVAAACQREQLPRSLVLQRFLGCHQRSCPGMATVARVATTEEVMSSLSSLVGHTAYVKEMRLLQYVLSTAKRDPRSVCEAMEKFGQELRASSKWLKIAGGEKLEVLTAAAAISPEGAVLEMGTYCGFSSLHLALQSSCSHVVTMEADLGHALIAEQIIAFAGMSHKVDIITGHTEDMLPWLLQRWEGPEISLVFLDQRGSRYHTDLQLLKCSGRLMDAAVIVADNVLKPGTPRFLWSLTGSAIPTQIIELQEYAMNNVLDWMTVSIYRRHSRNNDDDNEPPEEIRILEWKAQQLRNKTHLPQFGGPGVDFAEWSQFSREMREELCTALTLDVKSFVSPFDLTDFFESYSLQKRLA